MSIITGACVFAVLAVVVVRINFSRGPKTVIGPTRVAIAQVSTGVDVFEVDCERLPTNLQELITRPVDAGWNGPYVKDAVQLLDVWGRRMRYILYGNSYKITSAGPDGTFGNEDDISGF